MSVDAENLQIEELRAENADLRTRLEEAEDVLRAIRSGEVDALVIGDHLYTLASADAVSNWLRGEMLAQVNDAIVAVDNNNRVILNSAAERQYGVAASDVLGYEVNIVYRCRWLHPNDEGAAREALNNTDSWRGENVHVKHSGEEIAVESSITRLRDGGTPAF